MMMQKVLPSSRINLINFGAELLQFFWSELFLRLDGNKFKVYEAVDEPIFEMFCAGFCTPGLKSKLITRWQRKLKL